MKFLEKVPMAVSGLSLALASLGNLLLPYGEVWRYCCGTLSAAILCVYLLKLIFDFRNVKEDLKNPVVSSTFPTSTMALMLLCVYLKPFLGMAAVCLWYAAVVLQLLIMAFFVKRFVMGFKLQTVFPSWFVPGVGIVVASVTSPVMGAEPMGQAFFYLGFILYFVIAVVVGYRMLKVQPIPEPARPTTAIITAPMSLCLVGYFAAFDQRAALLVYIMFILAVISYIFVTVKMFSLLQLKFYPTYAAFTFPYVISAVAFNTMNAFLMESGYSFFQFVPKVTEWIAIAAVVYVLIRFAAFLFFAKPVKPAEPAKSAN
jgi:exfoliative toxin A/B